MGLVELKLNWAELEAGRNQARPQNAKVEVATTGSDQEPISDRVGKYQWTQMGTQAAREHVVSNGRTKDISSDLKLTVAGT